MVERHKGEIKLHQRIHGDLETQLDAMANLATEMTGRASVAVGRVASTMARVSNLQNHAGNLSTIATLATAAARRCGLPPATPLAAPPCTTPPATPACTDSGTSGVRVPFLVATFLTLIVLPLCYYWVARAKTRSAEAAAVAARIEQVQVMERARAEGEQSVAAARADGEQAVAAAYEKGKAYLTVAKQAVATATSLEVALTDRGQQLAASRQATATATIISGLVGCD